MRYEPLGKYVKLSQGLAVNKGTAYLFSDEQNEEYIYPLLRIVDFENGARNNYSKYVSKEVSKSVIINEDDIVFTRVTCQCFRGYSGVLHNNLFIVNLISDDITKDYLFTVLQSDFVRKQALKFAKSSVVPDLNHEMFKSIVIPVPDKNVQIAISSLYLNLTKKIENNNKICDELNSVSELIYDYWFLQYNFPANNGVPYKDNGGLLTWDESIGREIPIGWKTVKIGDLFEDNRGISYSTREIETGEGVPMINLASFSPDNKYKQEGLKYYSGEYVSDKVLKPYDLVICNTQQTAIDYKKDIIGKALLVPDIFAGDVLSSHHVTSLKTYNPNVKYYLYKMFNTKYFHKFLAGYTNGTNILGLLFDNVKECVIPLPDNETLEKFADVIQEMETKISLILKENEELEEIKEFLLPLVLSGQIQFM